MKRSRILILGSGVAMLAMAVACSDLQQSPLQPIVAPSSALVASVVEEVHVLQRLTPLAENLSASARITRNGGVIEIPEAGVRVQFPQGAVQEPTVITVTALAGSNVAYHFAPHGLTFQVPVQVRQNARLTEVWRNAALDPRSVRGAYFGDLSDLEGEGTARVTEYRSTAFEQVGINFRWSIDHFSGYLLSTGRVVRPS